MKNFLRKCLAGSSALVLIGLSAPAQAATPTEDLDALVQTTIARYQSIPDAGYAVVVMKNGQTLLSQGYGLRDKGQNLPMTPATKFYIGSNTKSFTSLSLALMRDQGLVDFDQPFVNYIPNFRLSDPNITAQITTEDMLAHRSGLPRHDNLLLPTGLTRGNIVYRMRFLEFDSRPDKGFRTSFQYNNLMYVAAGLLPEKIASRTWEAFTQERILTPLGMSNTGFGKGDFSGSPDRALPYDINGLPMSLPFEVSDNAGPSGSMYSTAEDMAKYLSLYVRLGRLPSGQALVSESSLEQIFNPHNASNDRHLLRNAIATYYGLGWWVDYDGTNWAGYHGGSVSGYFTQMAFDRANQIAIVVLANHRSDPAVNPLVQEIFAYLHGMPPAPSPTGTPVPPPGPTPTPAPPSAPLSTIATFTHPGYGDLSIATDGARYFYQWLNQVWPITQTTYTAYTYWKHHPTLGGSSVVSTLERQPDGRVSAIFPGFDPFATSRFVRK